MQCKKCGAMNPDNANVCCNCHNPLSNENTMIYEDDPTLLSSQDHQTPNQPVPNQTPPYPQYVVQQAPQRNDNTKFIIIVFVLVAIISGAVVLFVMHQRKAVNPDTTVEEIHDTVYVETAAPASASNSSHSSSRSTKVSDVGYTDYSWLCSRYVTDDDLVGKSKAELSIMRNTIFARHGYIFRNPELAAYFSQFDWYVPRSSNVYLQLNEIEEHNVGAIKAYE